MTPQELEAYWFRQENIEIIREAIGVLDNFSKDLNVKNLKCTISKSALDNNGSHPQEEKWVLKGIVSLEHEASSQGGRIIMAGITAMRKEMTTIASELIVQNQDAITKK